MKNVIVALLAFASLGGNGFCAQVPVDDARSELLSIIAAATPKGFSHLVVSIENINPAATDFSAVKERSVANIAEAIKNPANRVQKTTSREIYFWQDGARTRTEITPQIGEQVRDGVTQRMAVEPGIISFSAEDGAFHTRHDNISVMRETGDIAQMGEFVPSDMEAGAKPTRIEEAFAPELIFSSRGISYGEYFSKELSAATEASRDEDESAIRFSFVTRSNDTEAVYEFVVTKSPTAILPHNYSIESNGKLVEEQYWEYVDKDGQQVPAKSVLRMAGLSDPSAYITETVSYSFSNDRIDESQFTAKEPISDKSKALFNAGRLLMAERLAKGKNIELSGKIVSLD